MILESYKICSVSLLALILFFFFINIWSYIEKSIKQNICNKKRLCIVTTVLSFFISFSYIYGTILEKNMEQKCYITMIEIMCLVCSIIPIINTIFIKLQKIEIKKSLKNNDFLDKNHRLMLSKKLIILIIVVWIIGYLALWPGVYGYDAPYWIKCYIQTTNINTHFSPVYVGVFSLLIRIGLRLFKSYTIGFGIFSFMQMLFILFCIYQILKFLETYLEKKITIIAALYFCIIPTHMILAVSSAQDSMFMAWFSIILIEIVKMSINAQDFWKDKKSILTLVVSSIFFCLTRNNGIYVIALLTLFSFLYTPNYRKKMFIHLGIVIVIYYVISGPIFKICGVKKDSNTLREMLSLPVMQLDRTYIYNSNSFTQEDKEKYLQYIDEESINYYKLVPEISDNQKIAINTDLIKEKPMEFIKLYIKIGTKDVRNYIKAPLLSTLGLWYPNKQYYDSRMYHPYIETWCLDPDYIHSIDKDYVEINRESKIPILNEIIGKLFGNKAEYGSKNWKMLFNEIPIFSAFCKSGTYFILYLFVIGYSIYKKDKSMILMLIFVGGLITTVFLGPVVLYRYMAPIIFSSPIWTTAILIKKQHKAL